MTLQLSHIFFTDALTFILTLPCGDATAYAGKMSCMTNGYSSIAQTQPATRTRVVAFVCVSVGLPNTRRHKLRLCYFHLGCRLIPHRQNLRTVLSNCNRMLEMR